ncbi:hypothetical protein GGI23_005802 [Coemansia sp. RSA 2559]|nr:hypothetical protein GGI23_005802 [Coemansia sp. RSA 2559]KAJ2854653.1 hypothetical protein GGI22_004419 [Coemansia erecta]
MLRLLHSFAKVQVASQHLVRTFSTARVVTKAVVTSSGKPNRVAAVAKPQAKRKSTKKAKAATASRPKAGKRKKVKTVSAEEKMINSRSPLVVLPKRPIKSGYMQFYKDQYKETAAASDSSKGVADAAREMTLRWKRLSESEKAKYVSVAQAQRAQYEKDLVDWWKSVDRKMVDLENKRRRRHNMRINERTKAGEAVRGSKLKLLKDPLHPKNPMTSYMKFCSSKLADPYANGEMSMAQRVQQIGVQWRSMSAAEKAPYVQAAAAEKAAHTKAMEKYLSSIHH